MYAAIATNTTAATAERSAIAVNGSTPAAMAGRAKRLPTAWASAVMKSG